MFWNSENDLIVKIAVLSGTRPGEIFALTWDRLQGHYAEIRQRIYKGHLDTPKTVKSVREGGGSFQRPDR
jgi:integrase